MFVKADVWTETYVFFVGFFPVGPHLLLHSTEKEAAVLMKATGIITMYVRVNARLCLDDSQFVKACFIFRNASRFQMIFLSS